ncbi:MAG: RNA polymerase sigma factor [Candidatus Promineofilum sp.]|nr:RNA polymerase sigma factor [Promineifilum sp.]
MQPFEAAGERDFAADTELVRRARRDSPAAWEELVGRHQEPVFRLAYLILGDAADAEDVAQETFIRAYRALARFDDARPLRPWLLSIAANLARNRRRNLGRYWAALQRAFRQNPEPYHAPPERTEAADARRLRQAVSRLRPNARDIVYLRYFLGLSEAEAAAALGIPAGTAKSRLSRALAQLRQLIEAEYPDLRDALGDG